MLANRQTDWKLHRQLACLLTVLFLFATGTGHLSAAAESVDDDQDGIPNSVECIGRSVTTPIAVINGSFESPDIPSTLSLTSKRWGSLPKIAVAYKSFLIDGWSTTATDSEIELWRKGFNGVKPQHGKQFAEINANQSAALYQEITTIPGVTMQWSFAHRGRTGMDTIELLVGPPDGSYTSLGIFSTGKSAWSTYSGTYVVPAGQTVTRFWYKAISTANGNNTTGNFLDNIQFYALSDCTLDTDGDGIINSSDLDSDNDGILDIIEAGLTDDDGDGQVDQESDLGSAGTVPDQDSDDIPNFLDLDADADGIPDVVEAQPTDDFTPPSGQVDATGVYTVYNGGFSPVDTDEDDDPDYLDLDSDGDEWPDTTEGHVELLNVDVDADGLDKAVDPDDNDWGPPAGGITTTLSIYPNDGTENHWRNQEIEEDGTGVGPGAGGGLESEPLPGAPSRFIGSIGTGTNDGSVSATASQAATALWHKARIVETHMLGLDDLMPMAGPQNTTPKAAVPVDVLAVTNAPDAKAVDFIDKAGNIQAVALGIVSVGAPYVHDYGVCNRFKGFTFDQIVPQLIDVPPANRAWFWHSTANSTEYGYEDALIFHIFVNEAEKHFYIDSSWTQDSYGNSFDFAFDYVFNMQVWSNNPKSSQQLLQAILLRLDSFGAGDWQVTYHNAAKPTAPTVFISQAETKLDAIRLELTTLGEEVSAAREQSIRIYGTWRSQLDRLTLQPFEQTMVLTDATQDVTLALPGLLDATVYVESNGFVDKIYAGGGLWFAAGQSQGTAENLTLGDCRSTGGIDPQDLLLAGCADMSATVATAVDSIGIGRTLNPNGMPVDVSPYRALRFWAKGNGMPVRILLESANITDADYYQTVFVPTHEWQQYIIPLNQFEQRGFGKAVPFTGTDLKAVLWLNAEASRQPLTLALDQVSFTNAGLITPQTLAKNNADINARNITFVAPKGMAIANTMLHYSLNDGQSFQRIPLSATRTEEEATLLQGQLPAQPLGTDVRYFVEMTHTNGYKSRLPVDAPQSYYRYQVDDRPSVLVDDFGGSGPVNRVGGGNGLFNHPTAGGMLTAYRVNQQLILDHAVTQDSQYAGYYAELQNLDANVYTTIDLLVRGATGGEQLHIGLRDQNGYEPRLSIGDFLPGGLQREWQWVQIPLASFGTQLDRTALHSLSLTFDNNYTPTSGRVYVDEIRFTTLATPVVIDSFDDHDMQQNGQGFGYWISAPQSSLTAEPIAGDATVVGGAALQLDYTVGTDGYALWHSDLGGVAAKANAILSFWVRGDTQPVPVSIYLTDATTRARIALADYVTLTQQWQLVQVPLADFLAQGLGSTQLTGFEIAFEFGTGSGTLWVDNIRLGSSGAPQVNRRTLHLQGGSSQSVALHLPDGGTWSVTSDTGWLKAAGTEAGSGTLTVQSLPWGLAVGEHTGTLTIEENATQQREQITVYLNVVEPMSTANQIFLPVVSR